MTVRQPSDVVLFRLASVLAVVTFVLIVWGGHVNTTRSGMAFPDWPTSNAAPMVTYAPSEWLWQSDRFWEHGHRLLATVVGALTVTLLWGVYRRTPVSVRPSRLLSIGIGIAVAAIIVTVVTAILGVQTMPGMFMESFMGALVLYIAFTVYRAVRGHGDERLLWLTFAAFGGVCLQGMFGGYTVLNNLPDWTSTTHGVLAQCFFMTVIGVTLILSPRWQIQSRPRAVPSSVRRIAVVAWASVLVQFLLGALTRHTDAWGVSSSWPHWSDEGFFPNVSLLQFSTVAIHLAHRTWAYGVAILVVALWWVARREQARDGGVLAIATGLMSLVFVQIMLGAGILWTARGELVTTAHVAIGVLMVAGSTVVMLNSFRLSAAAYKLDQELPSVSMQGGVGVRA